MHIPLRYVWLLIVALLGFFIGGKWNMPVAAWIAPVFALRFFRESPHGWQAFVLLWLVSSLGTIVSWSGATFLGGIHPLAEAGFFLLLTPVGLIPYLLDRHYHRQFGATFWQTLVLPLALTATDFLTSSDGTIGSFGAMAYAQRGFLPAMQLGALVGLSGMAFMISWFATLVNMIWERGIPQTRMAQAGIATIGLLLVLGAGRVALAVPPAQTVKIGGFSLPAGGIADLLSQRSDPALFHARIAALHAQQLQEITRLANQGAKVVVLQEGAGLGESDQVAQLLADAGELARQHNLYILLPTFDLGKQPAENRANLIDPTGQVVLSHVKYGGNAFEGSRKGDGTLQVVATPYGRMSAVVCWDADYPAVIKQAGLQAVDLLFIPANDWVGVKDIHAGMASFRAVENGTSIVRQTGDGVTLVTDGYGREYQRIDSFASPVRGFTSRHLTDVPVGRVATLYPRIGDSVGYACVALLLALIVGVWFTRKQTRIV